MWLEMDRKNVGNGDGYGHGNVGRGHIGVVHMHKTRRNLFLHPAAYGGSRTEIGHILINLQDGMEILNK